MSKFRQNLGEHIQSYVWRLELDMALNLKEDEELEEAAVVKQSIRGLLPQIVAVMPRQNSPWTKDQLFWFADNLKDYLPPNDPFWSADVRPQSPQPDIKVQIVNEYAAKKEDIPRKCYKCGLFGHFAYSCKNPRNKSLKKKRKKPVLVKNNALKICNDKLF